VAPTERVDEFDSPRSRRGPQIDAGGAEVDYYVLGMKKLDLAAILAAADG